MQVKSTDGKIRKKFDFNPKLVWDKPLIILVSRYSASASEIVAGALQNHRRAIIVGDKNTHGKGTVQSLLQMNLPLIIIRVTKEKCSQNYNSKILSTLWSKYSNKRSNWRYKHAIN